MVRVHRGTIPRCSLSPVVAPPPRQERATLQTLVWRGRAASADGILEAVETALSSAASLTRDEAVARVVDLLGYALRM